MSARTSRARRDPEGRRRAIVEAAAALLVEDGVVDLTHRRVAERAGLPLGATTYYFASLDELTTAALDHLAAEIDAELQALADVLAQRGLLAAVLAEELLVYLADRDQLRIDSALYFAGVTDARLRPHALRWFDGLVAVLSPYMDAERAWALAIFTDGAFTQAALRDEPLDAAALERAIAALLGDDEPAPARPADRARARRGPR